MLNLSRIRTAAIAFVESIVTVRDSVANLEKGIPSSSHYSILFPMKYYKSYLVSGVAPLFKTGKKSLLSVALSGEISLRNVQLIGEDEKFLEPKCPVGVNAIVHRGEVADLVWAGSLSVSPRHSVDMPLVVLKRMQALEYRGFSDKVLALKPTT